MPESVLYRLVKLSDADAILEIYRPYVESTAVTFETAVPTAMEAKQILPTIAMGTVYRNLGLMAAAGEVLRIEMPGRPDRFDKTVVPHHHCVCVRCGEVYDIPIPDLSLQLSKMLRAPVEGYDLTVHVICDACRAKEAAVQ